MSSGCPTPTSWSPARPRPLPVEVVVRGYITGVTDTSLWRQYDDGARTIYGHRFPDGLAKNTALPEPIVTPTTKAEHGGHDEPITCDEVVTRGLLDADLWERVMAAALEVFHRGTARGARGWADPRRHQVRVRSRHRRFADADRRGAHARLVAVVGRRHATTTVSPPARNRRASTRRSSGGRTPRSATAATVRCRSSPTTCGPRRRRATSTPTSASPARRSSPARTRSPSASSPT